MKWIVEKVLRNMVRSGRLTIVYHDGSTRVFGPGGDNRPQFTVRMHDRGVPWAIVSDPRLGLAEAFMDGRIDIEGGDIMDFLAFMRHDHPWEWTGSRAPKETKRNPIAKRALRLGDLVIKVNDRRRARANAAHHYDLSNALYSLFLDRDMQYSCAYWPDIENSIGIDLDRAQEDKRNHIAAKLRLSPGQRVLDIGCGWGGLALDLHRQFGVDVLGITLSTEQLKVAQARAIEAGVQDHVKFELRDFRDVEGSFDRIVSVGMFEHVGVEQYSEFFRMCHNLLTPHGVMLLHTIGRMGVPTRTDAFTGKYIFPGCYVPSLSEIVTASEQNKLMVADIETLRLHYALTLREWYRRTVAHRSEIVAIYDERFFRMWTFYLAVSTAAFETGGLVNFQIQYIRNRRALPITRDYMMAEAPPKAL